jgi:colicin import membrane protein
MRLSLKAIAKAKAAFETNDLSTVEKALTDANSAWSANEQIKRLQVKLADERQKAAEAAKADAAEKAALAKANAEKLAKLKAEAEKAAAEVQKAKEAEQARLAEAEAKEKEESDRQSRNSMIKYSLGGVAVIALGFVAMRKKSSTKVEVLPASPAADSSSAEDSPAE